MAKQVTGTSKCGWCIDGIHDKCKVSVTWYDKTWYCGCACRSESESKPRRKKEK